MSYTSCSLLKTSTPHALISPTSNHGQQQLQLPTILAPNELAHDLINMYAHHDSPDRSAADFIKRPLINKPWPKAVLSRLSTPLRLLPAPLKISKRPRDSTPIRQCRDVVPAVSAGDLSSPSAPQPRLLAPTRLPAVDTTSPITETSAQATSCTHSSLFNTAPESANDVEQLLHILATPSLSNDIETSRTHILTELCTLLHAPSPDTAVQKFVAAGGVQTMLNIVNSVAQPSRLSAAATAPNIVEESEKALLLIQLSTFSSQDACTAALQHSASITATALGKMLLRISETCTASAIAVLTSLCRHSNSNAILFRQAVSRTAIPSKLVVVLQVASKDSTKRRAARLLRLLGEEQKQEQTESIHK